MFFKRKSRIDPELVATFREGDLMNHSFVGPCEGESYSHPDYDYLSSYLALEAKLERGEPVYYYPRYSWAPCTFKEASTVTFRETATGISLAAAEQAIIEAIIDEAWGKG